MMNIQTQNGRPFVALAVTVAVFLALLTGIALAHSFGQVDSLTARRVGSIGIGIVLIAAGNLLPKMRLFYWPGLRPERVATAERFAGWTLVLTGVAVVSLWLFAASDNTMLISSAVATAAFALVIANWALISFRGHHKGNALLTVDNDVRSVRAARTKRLALFQILFALFWVFAMFLAYSLWGSRVVLWMLVAFSIALALSSLPLFFGLLTSVHRKTP